MPSLQKRKTKTEKGEFYSFFLTIPKEFIDLLGWDKGDTILINYNDNKTITLKKAE